MGIQKIVNNSNLPTEEVKFDIQQVKDYVAVIYPTPLTGRIEFRLIKKINKENMVESRFYSSPLQINWVEIEAMNLKGWNIYYGIGLRNGSGTGTKNDIVQIPGIWVEIDSKDFPGGLQQIIDEMKNKLKETLHPSIITDSGHGRHCIWLFEKPELIKKPEDIDWLESYINGFRKYLGGDHTQDICRVLRLPGSINMKYPDKPVPCRLLEYHPERKFKLNDFEEYNLPFANGIIDGDQSIPHFLHWNLIG